MDEALSPESTPSQPHDETGRASDPEQWQATGSEADYAALRFRCELGQHWPRLLPLSDRSQMPASVAERAEYVFNRRLHCQLEVNDAHAWEQRMRAIAYAPALPVIWVEHPLWGYPEAYWPDAPMLALLQALASGQKDIASLDPDCFELLSTAHALVLDDAEQAEQREALFAHWQARLAQEGYLHLPKLISPLQVAALREYTRQRRRLGPLQHEDSRCCKRVFRVYDQVINFWHQHLLRVLRQVTGEALRSSYNVISYYEDTALSRHKDRDPCIWNVSLALDTQPAAAEGAPWAFWLETVHGPTPILLQAGDALLYRGREMPHWREPLPPDRQETVLLFHFVDEAYRGSLC